jgi:hypothetical protein
MKRITVHCRPRRSTRRIFLSKGAKLLRGSRNLAQKKKELTASS